MGAHDISITLNKRATRDEIAKAFKAQKDSDADENGHQSGYSGDFQTVDKVDFHLDKVFPTENAAMEYCLDKAQKWTSVVAVYFNDAEPVKNKTIGKMNATIKKLTEELNKLSLIPLDKSKAFKTCGGCKSRLAVAHVNRHSCPVCQASLRPKAIENKLIRLKAKIDELNAKGREIVAKDQEKQAANPKNVRTLIAGWGAC